jgi:hypothetical protein
MSAMNSFTAARYLENVQRLALGVEPIDAAREQPLLTPVMLTHDDAPFGNARPAFQRHPSSRQVLLYDTHYAAAARNVDLRFFDQTEALYDSESDRRRFVPRRLRIAVRSLADAEAAPAAARGCRPWLYAGAAYGSSDCASGVRGHALRAAAGPLPLRPARWARVLATVPATQPDLTLATIVGRAACDARGEFLLLLRAHPASLSATSTLSVRLRVFAGPELAPPSLALPAIDPLWDLPLEQPATLADNDPVLRGEALPAGYVQVAERNVDLSLGRLLRGLPPLVF